MLALAGFVYLTFFVQLGGYTLYGHVSRIADTSEARELTDALARTFGELVEGARQRFEGLGSTAAK
jgi:hypothetical protein